VAWAVPVITPVPQFLAKSLQHSRVSSCAFSWWPGFCFLTEHLAEQTDQDSNVFIRTRSQQSKVLLAINNAMHLLETFIVVSESFNKKILLLVHILHCVPTMKQFCTKRIWRYNLAFNSRHWKHYFWKRMIHGYEATSFETVIKLGRDHGSRGISNISSRYLATPSEHIARFLFFFVWIPFNLQAVDTFRKWCKITRCMKRSVQ
jgi:hypothetical protein